MSHLGPQGEIPDQGATIDQDRVHIQDQGPIGQDLIATIDLITGIRKQNQRLYINAVFMGEKLKTIQQ